MNDSPHDWAEVVRRHRLHIDELNAKREIEQTISWCISFVLDYDKLVRVDRECNIIWKGPLLVMSRVSNTRYPLGTLSGQTGRGRRPYLVVHEDQIKRFSLIIW